MTKNYFMFPERVVKIENHSPCPDCQNTDIYSDKCVMSWLIGWNRQTIDGIKHTHDPNEHGQIFKCGNDHFFEKRWFNACPVCGKVAGGNKVKILKEKVE